MSGTVGGGGNALDLTRSRNGEIMATGSVERILEEGEKIGDQFLTFQEEPKENLFGGNVNFKKNQTPLGGSQNFTRGRLGSGKFSSKKRLKQYVERFVDK